MGAFLASMFGPSLISSVAPPILRGATNLLGGLFGGGSGANQSGAGQKPQIQVASAPDMPQYTPPNSGYLNQPSLDMAQPPQQNGAMPMPPGYLQM